MPPTLVFFTLRPLLEADLAHDHEVVQQLPDASPEKRDLYAGIAGKTQLVAELQAAATMWRRGREMR